MKRRTDQDSKPSTTQVQSANFHPLLSDDERQRCEVWTRVMGYHRPVSSFNTGKKGEHAERKFFNEKTCKHL